MESDTQKKLDGLINKIPFSNFTPKYLDQNIEALKSMFAADIYTWPPHFIEELKKHAAYSLVESETSEEESETWDEEWETSEDESEAFEKSEHLDYAECAEMDDEENEKEEEEDDDDVYDDVVGKQSVDFSSSSDDWNYEQKLDEDKAIGNRCFFLVSLVTNSIVPSSLLPFLPPYLRSRLPPCLQKKNKNYGI